jgi:hypothetical protein
MTPDPNSIEGRQAIGYWEDDVPGLGAVDAVDANWDDAEEKQMVTMYLQRAFASTTDEDTDNTNNKPHNDCDIGAPRVLKSWRGLASCRICDEILGNTCHGDANYNWPDGYLHYLEQHQVKPPQHFIDHVRKQMLTKTTTTTTEEPNGESLTGAKSI